MPYIAVDMDGTLAFHDYSKWSTDGSIGEPIPAMVERVKGWLARGITVKIMTARVGIAPEGAVLKDHDSVESQRKIVESWCMKHLGQVLEVTCKKDYGMVCLFDDRCRQVELNTGRLIGGEPIF